MTFGSDFLAKIETPCVPTTLFNENNSNSVVSRQYLQQESNPLSENNNRKVQNSEEDENFKFTIYPNPVRNSLYIEGEVSAFSIELYNAMGNQVKVQNNFNQNRIINFEHLASGIYYLKILSKNNQNYQIHKVVKL